MKNREKKLDKRREGGKRSKRVEGGDREGQNRR
jgi:hypothetical protein